MDNEIFQLYNNCLIDLSLKNIKVLFEGLKKLGEIKELELITK